MIQTVARPMTRTDLVLAALRVEIERHRAALDADATVREVCVTVKLRPETGLPWLVRFTTECVREPGRS